MGSGVNVPVRDRRHCIEVYQRKNSKDARRDLLISLDVAQRLLDAA
jgi:hypothetical protein